MRFLQTEWHRHERERNAWQIERAEMKSRIGKLEGDGRTNKRLRESMDKHIRLLEHALKKEREKAKSSQSGSQTEDKKEESQVTKQNVRPIFKGRDFAALSNYLVANKTRDFQANLITPSSTLNPKINPLQVLDTNRKEIGHGCTSVNASKRFRTMSCRSMGNSNIAKSQSKRFRITNMPTISNHRGLWRRPMFSRDLIRDKSSWRTISDH